MGTWRKAYGALKDSTIVGLAKVNSEYKEIDIAIVKASNHEDCPPKERHMKKIFSATSAVQSRVDIAYCIYALGKRLAKTRSWVVALKILLVIHRTLREGDPTFKEELLSYAKRGNVLEMSNFKDDSSPLAWDCSAWVRTYAHFLEERLECFRILKYDIEAENLVRNAQGTPQGHSKTRTLSCPDLLEQMPALQQLLYRLVGCQPEGGACRNYLVQYALALVLKESFKIYCGINDGIINLVDMFFEMPRYDALKSFEIYKRAGQQAECLSIFYEFCKNLDMARNFKFPTLRQPPPSFLATMEEYIHEAPQIGIVSNKNLEYEEINISTHEVEKERQPVPTENQETRTEGNDKNEELLSAEEPPLLIGEDKPEPEAKSTGDLLGLEMRVPVPAEFEERNSLALAIIQPGDDNSKSTTPTDLLSGGSGWELALVTAPCNSITNQVVESKLAGGFDKLLLDSLYEDASRRQQIARGTFAGSLIPNKNPFDSRDPFSLSSSIAAPPNVQMAAMAQQQQQQMMMMVPYAHHHQADLANPFGDLYSAPTQGNMNLL